MHIIDAQLHEFGPSLSWDPPPDDALRDRVLAEITLAWMEAVGVHAAVLNPTSYGTPLGWGDRMAEQLPDRFATVQTFHDPRAPELEEQIATFADRPGLAAFRVGVGRISQDPDGSRGAQWLRSGVYDRLFAACEANDAPLFCHAAGNCELLHPLLDAHPRLQLVVDHIGLPQPPIDDLDVPPWRRLDELLGLARHERVAVKLCGAPVLSAQPHPFADVWPHVHRILEAFGPGRVMWASDAGRFVGRIGWDNVFPSGHGEYPGKHRYSDALGLFLHTDELGEREKAQLLGGTAAEYLSLPAALRAHG